MMQRYDREDCVPQSMSCLNIHTALCTGGVFPLITEQKHGCKRLSGVDGIVNNPHFKTSVK